MRVYGRLIPYAGAESSTTRRSGGYVPMKPRTVLSLFRAGHDTIEIAKRLARSEATVSRLLARALDAERKIIRRSTP